MSRVDGVPRLTATTADAIRGTTTDATIIASCHQRPNPKLTPKRAASAADMMIAMVTAKLTRNGNHGSKARPIYPHRQLSPCRYIHMRWDVQMHMVLGSTVVNDAGL